VPVLVGTRVPLRNLIDDLEGGFSFDQFFDSFPSILGELRRVTPEPE
jgi:uncharacterized protein (DUF433 family)